MTNKTVSNTDSFDYNIIIKNKCVYTKINATIIRQILAFIPMDYKLMKSAWVDGKFRASPTRCICETVATKFKMDFYWPCVI